MRYDLDFKIKVIAYYWQGHTGVSTAKQFGLDDKMVFKGVQQYQSSGIDAIKPKTSKTTYSADFKYKVITSMLAGGLSQSQTALKFHISSPALISHWHKAYRLYGMSGLTSKYKGSTLMKPPSASKPDDEKTPTELKRELQYLRAENAYLKKLDARLREREQATTKQGSSKD